MQLLSATHSLGSCAALSSSRPTANVARQAVARRHNAIVAMAAAPKGVTQPPRRPVPPPTNFGFVDNAERLNSRAAMIGFFALLIVEAITNRSILELAGVTIGKGLDLAL